jgi:hypothetical protein
VLSVAAWAVPRTISAGAAVTDGAVTLGAASAVTVLTALVTTGSAFAAVA